MAEQLDQLDSIRQDSFVQLSAKELQAQRFQPRSINRNSQKKKPLRLQVSRPPPNAVRLRPHQISTHFRWAIVLTILCFFTIGPIWALYKTFTLRRMIERQELDAAARLSHRISTVLMFATIFGIFAWVAILFCSIGLLISGKLIQSRLV